MDRSKCVVLVPVNSHIEPECAHGLNELERMGYPVWRIYGCSAIDQARSQIASDALADGYEELMWIDSDIRFSAGSVDVLRAHDLPMTCGIYPKKGSRELVCHVMPETRGLVFGKGGGLVEVLYAATGFLLTKRCVYEKVAVEENLPECNVRFNRPLLPYFLPMIVPDGEGHWYLGEDFAFSERARRAGFSIYADTRIRLGHTGRYDYSWEDAGSDRERFGTYTFNFR